MNLKSRKRVLPVGLILYLPEEKGPGEKLLPIIQAAVPGCRIERCHSIEDLTERLRQPIYDIGLAVLYASTRADLMDLIYLGDLLGVLRVVLVLPDDQPDILEKAHLLRPRFIAATESDFRHLEGILKKMMDLYTKNYRE